MNFDISRLGAFADGFNEKAAESIKQAKESAVDKSIFEDKDKFVDYYSKEIKDAAKQPSKPELPILGFWGLVASGGVTGKVAKEVNEVGSTKDVSEALVNNGHLDADDAEVFNSIFDKNNDGVYTKDEIKELLGAAYDAYTQNIDAE